MKRTKEVIVQKHDETVERFSLPKLMNSIRSALEGRAYDGRLASPLARAVEMHLREWRGAEPPTTDYIFRCVISVLQQTGLADVADDMNTHRRGRHRRRRRVRISTDALRTPTAEACWQKLEIVQLLEGRYGLRHSVARFLAGQIEQQIFSLNYRVISRGFLAELVRNEVQAWGLATGDQSPTLRDRLEQPVGPEHPDEEP